MCSVSLATPFGVPQTINDIEALTEHTIQDQDDRQLFVCNR